MENSGEIPVQEINSLENQKNFDNAERGAKHLAQRLLAKTKKAAGIGFQVAMAGDDIAAIVLSAINPDRQNISPAVLDTPPSYHSEAHVGETAGAGSSPPIENVQPQIIHDPQGNPLAVIQR